MLPAPAVSRVVGPEVPKAALIEALEPGDGVVALVAAHVHDHLPSGPGSSEGWGQLALDDVGCKNVVIPVVNYWLIWLGLVEKIQ